MAEKVHYLRWSKVSSVALILLYHFAPSGATLQKVGPVFLNWEKPFKKNRFMLNENGTKPTEEHFIAAVEDGSPLTIL